MQPPVVFLLVFAGVLPMVTSQSSTAPSTSPSNGSDPNLGRDKALIIIVPVVVALVGVVLMCWWFSRQRKKSAMLQLDMDDESKRFDTAARRGLHMEHKLREQEEAEAAALSVQRKQQQQQQRATQMRMIPLGAPPLLRPQTLPPGSLPNQTLPPGNIFPPGSLPPQPLPPGSLPPAHRSASPPPGAIIVGPTVRTPIGQPLLQHSHTYPEPSMPQHHQPILSPLVHPPPPTFPHQQHASPLRLQTQPLLLRASTSPSVRTTPTIAPGWIHGGVPEYASPQPMIQSTPVLHHSANPALQYVHANMSPAPSPPVLITSRPPPPMQFQTTAPLQHYHHHMIPHEQQHPSPPPQPMIKPTPVLHHPANSALQYVHLNMSPAPSPPVLITSRPPPPRQFQNTAPLQHYNHHMIPHEQQHPSPPTQLSPQQQPRPQSTRSPPITTKEDMMLAPHARSLHEQTPVSPPVPSPQSEHHGVRSPPTLSPATASQPHNVAPSPPILLSPVSPERIRRDAELPPIPPAP
ncbi:hypothetical protein BJ742DRAFT_767047 [Cladochytrium replicatum]|nr:hypothetical protein BJ742DRAFT_767047 [Cladochytrium replicatum]